MLPGVDAVVLVVIAHVALVLKLWKLTEIKRQTPTLGSKVGRRPDDPDETDWHLLCGTRGADT